MKLIKTELYKIENCLLPDFSSAAGVVGASVVVVVVGTF